MDFKRIICGDCAKILAGFPDECIDLTMTSPPYDDMDDDYNPLPEKGLRQYNGYVWDFKAIAKQLWRVTKPGGVVVWVVNDPTINGSESLASSLQKIYFRRLGFNIHDTMIYEVAGTGAKGSNYAYWQAFEYAIVLSKGRPKTVNRIADIVNKRAGTLVTKGDKSKEIGNRLGTYTVLDTGTRTNIWRYHAGKNGDGPTDHPAPFPEALARDHIISWSNPGDVVLDPMCGSGTTLKMAKELGRQFVGIDISEEYCQLSEQRIDGAKVPLFVLPPEPNGKQEPEQLEMIA